MKNYLLIAMRLVVACVVLPIPLMSFAQEERDRHDRFRDLFHIGQGIYLSSLTSSGTATGRDGTSRIRLDIPGYSIQLLSAEQQAVVEKFAAIEEAQLKLLTRVELRLKMEERLEQRAKLLLEKYVLEREVARARSYVTSSIRVYYEVAHIGDDYVSLKKGTREMYVPLRSINSMFRGEQLPTPSQRSQRTGSTSRVVTLRHLDPLEVSKVVSKLFEDQPVKIMVGSEENSIAIEGEYAELDRVRDLIRNLDVEPD